MIINSTRTTNSGQDEELPWADGFLSQPNLRAITGNIEF